MNPINARIAMIYRNSPLYATGVRRGWIVKKINGYDIADILIRNDSKKLAEVLGPQEAGVTNAFLFSPPGPGRYFNIINKEPVYSQHRSSLRYLTPFKRISCRSPGSFLFWRIYFE